MPHKDPEAHRKYQREYHRKRRANMTPEQKEAKNERYREWYQNRTPEQIEAGRKWRREWYQNRTPEQKEAAREKDRERIANRTPEQKEAWNKYQKERNRNLTPEQREAYKKKAKEIRQNNNETRPSVVYVIECKETNKYYIGQTSTYFKARVTRHQSKFKSNCNTCGRGMQEDYNKYGPKAFEYSILKELDPKASQEELIKEEKRFIEKFEKEGKKLYNERYTSF